MAPILDVEKRVKHFQVWRNEAIEKINEVVDHICQRLDFEYLKARLSKIIKSWLYYENFEKEVNQCAVKYNLYRIMVD